MWYDVVMGILDIDKAERAIREFNEDKETLAMDRLVYRHFGAASSAAEQVILLDRLWGTQLFRRTGQVKRVIDCLEKGEGRIAAACRSLRGDALESVPAEVAAVAQRLLPIAMGHSGPDQPERPYTPYSFATKYLHWTTRCHFPIMDSRARLAICRLTQGHGDWPCIDKESPGPEDYPLWIEFYSRLLRSLDPQEREDLLAIDYDTQPRGEHCENSLLRVLDKVFYWWGSDAPGGAAS